MKRKRRPVTAAPATTNSLAADSSAAGGREGERRPQLVIIVPLEEPGTILLDAATLEDEFRLRLWLRRSSVLKALPGILARLLDDLDDHDRMAA
jgi:hypothetical protein